MQYRTGNPRERFPTRPGITGLRISRPAGRFTLTGCSRNVDIALTGLPLTPHRPPDIPEPLSQHIHSQSRIPIYVWFWFYWMFYDHFSAHSLLAKLGRWGVFLYMCPGFHHTAVCYMCPGFHRTAVIYVSGLSPYCCFIPIWTIQEQVSPWSSLTIRRTQSPSITI